MKRNTHFYFKQFAVRHDICNMKVGTDAVVLGAWVNVNQAVTLLDIGTGSGILALMLAQRTATTAHIDAIEIEEADATQARENVAHSPWPNKITVHTLPVQQFIPTKKYDLIISNPPYFNNSFEPPNKKRQQTRHTVSLDFNSLLLTVVRLLKKDGRLNVILPFNEGLELIALAKHHQLICSRQWSFQSRKEKPIERWLLEFRFDPKEKEEGEIIHYQQAEEWSADYKKLTQDFYLKL